jgi:hypothetical protein
LANADILDFLVGMSLPRGAAYGPENFAGDDLVREFLGFLKTHFPTDLDIYVSWNCRPDVSILRNKVEQVLVRSERLDTLLIEYVCLLQHLKKDVSHDLRVDRAMSSHYRWYTEFFIGFDRPMHALHALKKRHSEHFIHTKVIPFRDEALASVSALVRCSCQCFCLAHEIGHVVWPASADATIETPVDGISPIDHLKRDFSEQDFSNAFGPKTASEAAASLKPAHLFSEINADFFAIELLPQFLSRALGCDLETAFRVTLLACQAQFYMDDLRSFAAILARPEFVSADEEPLRTVAINSCQTSIRARSALRRAGISWALIENKGILPSAKRTSGYASRIDEIVVDDTRHMNLLKSCQVESGSRLLGVVEKSIPSIGDAFDEMWRSLRQEATAVMDLRYILIAFGCQEWIRPDVYLREMLTNPGF